MLEIASDEAKLTVRNVDWVIQGFKDEGTTYYVSELKNQGAYLVVADGGLAACFYKHVNFDDLLRDDSSEYPRKLLRDLCHLLGVSTFEGHNVDQYFRDEEWRKPHERSIPGRRQDT